VQTIPAGQLPCWLPPLAPPPATVQSSIAFVGQVVSQELFPPPRPPTPPPPPNDKQQTPVVHDVALHGAAGPELLVAELDAVIPVEPEPDWLAPVQALGAAQASTFCPLINTKQHCWDGEHVMPPQLPPIWPALLADVA
jgi:hypothetical protein